MQQREDSRDWLAIFGRDPNRKIFTKTVPKVPKPRDGLRRKPMAAPCQQEQPVKLPQIGFRSSGFVFQSFPFCPPNFSLDAAFVEVAEKRSQIRPKIDSVKVILFVLRELGGDAVQS